MRLVYNKRFQGPISHNSSIVVKSVSNAKYTHIGIQIPNKYPINELINWYSPGVEVFGENGKSTYIKPLTKNDKTNTFSKYDSTKDLNDDVDVEIVLDSKDGSSSQYYRVSELGILEFESLDTNSITIKAIRDLPVETIIDIAQSTDEE